MFVCVCVCVLLWLLLCGCRFTGEGTIAFFGGEGVCFRAENGAEEPKTLFIVPQEGGCEYNLQFLPCI